MKRMIHKPSPSMAVATLALVVALGGSSYAAFSVPKNSVGTKQLKNKAVTLKKISPKAQAAFKGQSTQIANGVVTSRAPGLSVSHADTAGVTDIRFLKGNQLNCANNTQCDGRSPVCPAGEVATGGGVDTFGHRGANIIESTFNYGVNNPSGAHRQWFGQIDNVSGTSANWEVDVICAPTSNALTASADRHSRGQQASR